ncbi:hypothetical protein KI688_002354 [Linnemannia hyalina]|uniref:Uncharacterized protein n=1 Tax=Linnemannia hyalina TaxID=64524 RepID=A0A9P8BQK5_9FUNG|nr:hypothetical protein KI688_002354 [Linnemannia hyalina]
MLRRLGGYVSNKWDTLRSIPEYDHQFPIFGLDAAGKSTLLYRLFYSEHVLALPDHNFRVETVSVWLHERLDGKEDEDGISGGLMLPRAKGLLRVCSGWMCNSEEGVRSQE